MCVNILVNIVGQIGNIPGIFKFLFIFKIESNTLKIGNKKVSNLLMTSHQHTLLKFKK